MQAVVTAAASGYIFVRYNVSLCVFTCSHCLLLQLNMRFSDSAHARMYPLSSISINKNQCFSFER
jgi:hypothetical protein